jgi:arylsulfate sulfotransferase
MAAPAFQAPPTIQQNPNPGVPLAAIVRFTANQAVRTTLEVSGGGRQWKVEYPESAKPESGLPLLGMRPGVRHEIRVRIKNKKGESAQAPAPLTFTTPELPKDPEFPPIQVKKAESAAMEPGITIISVRRGGRGPGGGPNAAGATKGKAKAKGAGGGGAPAGESPFATGYGLLLGLDNEGQVVWYLRTNSRISDFKRLQNGNIVYLTADSHAVEVDWLGNVHGEWYAKSGPVKEPKGVGIDTLTFHHAVEQASNGNLIVLGSEIREIDNYYTSETDGKAPRGREKIKGDEIVEFDRSGKIVWRWRAMDHLDVFRLGYLTFNRYWVIRGFPDTRDWSHGNGLYYDPKDNSLLLSLRQQSAIVKIARPSGKIQWILGEPGDWNEKLKPLVLKAPPETKWFWHQHGPAVTPQGNVLVFNNDIIQTRPFAPPAPDAKAFTRAMEYRVDARARTTKLLWESETEGPDNVFTFAMGDVDYMPKTGNILIHYGSATRRDDVRNGATPARPWARVREVTHTHPPRAVYDVVLAADEVRPTVWMMFGGERWKPAEAGW